MPKLVPIPTSPSLCAPSSVASACCRYSSPRSACASTTTPLAKTSSTPSTSTPAGELGIVKRIRPSALLSTGPLKISPLGMLRRPSLFIQLRPFTLSFRSVPSASILNSRTPSSRSISSAWKAPSSPHAAGGSGRSRKVAPRTKAANSSSSIPASSAPAGVGQSVEHQRFFIVRSRSGLRARAARAIRAGSTPASSRASCGA